MVTTAEFSPLALSELASALATVELEAGSRRARKLFRQSLVKPTENAVAQAEWAAREHKAVTLDQKLLDETDSFEGRAMASYDRGEWQTAYEESLGWLRDEPFSTHPAVLGSYVASIGLGDHKQALSILDAAFVANAEHWLILNNRAYALLNLGRLEQAEEAIGHIDRGKLTERDRGVVRATEGALLFRRGRYAEGRTAYVESIKAFTGTEGNRVRALAALCWAQEEVISGRPDAAPIVEAAATAAKAVAGANADVRALLNRVRVLTGRVGSQGAPSGIAY
jgi:tetratricopeptide (TPR) repeat protein